MPAAVAASIAGELASLAPTSRALLDGAAVAGEPFELGLAAAVAEMPEPEGLDALDDLLELDLIRPTAVPSRFRFRHPLVRSAVYESTRGGWRLAAHARAAEALAERGADGAELANHVERYAARGDERAIALLLEAGRAAMSRAPAEAVRWFEGTLRLLPGSDTNAGSTCVSSSRRRCARSAGSTAAAQPCSMRSTSWRPMQRRGVSS